MKLVIGTTLWKRASIERTTLRRFDRMREAYPEHDITLVAVGSEGDESRDRAEEHGWVYEEFPNEPLGAKHNRMLTMARAFDPEAFLVVGSDDWISDPYLDYVVRHLEEHPIIGLRDLIFAHARRESAAYWSGYPEDHPRHGTPIGPSRVFRRDVLDQFGWTLWEHELSRNLDGSTERRLREMGVSWHCPTMDETGSCLIDWKSYVNIWGYSKFVEDEVDLHEVLSTHFPSDSPPRPQDILFEIAHDKGFL